nr:hypothetical protein [Tanacetum cinerariifolium]
TFGGSSVSLKESNKNVVGLKNVISLISQSGTMSVLQPRSNEVGFINHMLILKLSKSIIQQQDR